MWDGWEGSFACKTIVVARLLDHQRVFNKRSTANWGSLVCPCPTLNVKAKAGEVCLGLAFEFEDTHREAILAALKKREGPDFEQIDLDIVLHSGDRVQGLLSICTNKLIAETSPADLVASLMKAKGKSGSGVDYVTRTHQRLTEHGIHDPVVTAIHELLPKQGKAEPTTPSEQSTVPQIALIRKLTIKKFRGLEDFVWHPEPGMNVIIGGGDVGKSTVLEALALLFSPTNSASVSEVDYWLRDNTQEFVIEAVMSLSDGTGISSQNKFSWPWAWDGKDAVLPAASEEDDIPAPADPVYRVRARGTDQMDVAWEIVQPDDTADSFSVAVRRKIGLVRLSADERNDRDLRLVYGSALDRLISDTSLRARIGAKVSELDLHGQLNAEGQKALEMLDQRMVDAALPCNLKLGLTSSQGISIGSLVGLMAAKEDVSIPLASWGAGTRRLAALEIASSSDKTASIAVIDEIERGLEPYRLRQLIRLLREREGQVFFTTHSPVAIACTTDAHLWYLGVDGNIGALPHKQIAQQQRRDPETFLAKLAVIAEGPTEVGMLNALLEKAFPTAPLDHGVRVCNGEGNDAVLGLLQVLAEAGVPFAGFVDDEGRSSGRLSSLKEKLGDLLFKWGKGCTEENVIKAIPDTQLSELLKFDGDLDGDRLRSLADRLRIPDKDIASIQSALTAAGKDFRTLIIEAATGNTDGAPEGEAKTWKRHSQMWFKSEAGGRELTEKMVQLGAWRDIEPQVLPLINAVLSAVGLAELTELKL